MENTVFQRRVPFNLKNTLLKCICFSVARLMFTGQEENHVKKGIAAEYHVHFPAPHNVPVTALHRDLQYTANHNTIPGL